MCSFKVLMALVPPQVVLVRMFITGALFPTIRVDM